MPDRDKDPQAIDPPENTSPSDNAIRVDATEESASAVDPPEDTKQSTKVE